MAIDETSKKISRIEDSPPPLPTSAPPPISHAGRGKSADCPFAAEQHDGKQMANVSIQLPPKVIYNFIFEDEGFLGTLYTNRKYLDRIPGPWESDAESGEQTRRVTYKATLPSKALGAAFSSVTEIQTRSKANKEGEVYVVNSEVINEGIMYADNFVIYIHYCIVREASKDPNIAQSRFSYYVTVKFKKSPFFVIKNLIEKSALDGMEILCKDIVAELKVESEKLYGAAIPSSSGITKRANQNGLVLRNPEKRRKGKRAPESPPSKSIWKSKSAWLVWSLLLLLGCMNVYLLNQLVNLERKADDTYNKIKSLSPSVNQPVEGDNLEKNLREMERLELLLPKFFERWKGQIDEAYRGLSLAEEAIRGVRSSVPEYEGEWNSFLNTAKSALEADDVAKSE